MEVPLYICASCISREYEIKYWQCPCKSALSRQQDLHLEELLLNMVRRGLTSARMCNNMDPSLRAKFSVLFLKMWQLGAGPCNYMV